MSSFASKPIIEPLMFCSGNYRLMGVHYVPSPQSKRGVGVLMCNQVGPNYAEYYKTARMLVNMLVARGFDCLRFDYVGCGDSGGGFEDGSVRQWISDISSAEMLLKERSGCSAVLPCGFGFGALLATAHAAASDVKSLVMWEPVVNGQSYCRTLRRLHKQWLRGSFVKAMKVDKEFQALGFPASTDLEHQMCQLKLTDLSSCRAGRVFAVVGLESSEQALIPEYFGRYGISVQSCAPGESLPLQPMRAVVAWLEGGGGDE